MALRVRKAEMTGFEESNLALFGGHRPEPIEVGWHNPPVMEAALEFGTKAEAWTAVDASLSTALRGY